MKMPSFVEFNLSDIHGSLVSMSSPQYRDFISSLLPSVSKNEILGVPTPCLRRFARRMSNTLAAQEFMSLLPHRYHEENNLHAFLIEKLKVFDETISALDVFLPYVDNWATCDGMCPTIFKTNRKELLPHIHRWLASKHEYTIRYGMVLLMKHYLDEEFEENYLELVSSVCSDAYYVRMMQAWFFATALAKQPQSTLPYLMENRLPRWIHNKTIQKAVESRRISTEMKTIIKALKRKEDEYGAFNS